MTEKFEIEFQKRGTNSTRTVIHYNSFFFFSDKKPAVITVYNQTDRSPADVEAGESISCAPSEEQTNLSMTSGKF